jgi:DNA-3-methyladenine glycosylase
LTENRLLRDVYLRDTEDVARRLLGCRIVRDVDGIRLVGRIVETEAYLGEQDLGAHPSRGRTNRTEVMYGPPGRAYVYLIYGMYHCLNAVTQPEGTPHAVLIRAVEPLDGLDVMRSNRRSHRTGKAPARDTDLTNGPGKLTNAMGVNLKLNRVDLVDGDDLWIERGDPIPFNEIAVGPRIGIDYAGDWVDAPLRFWIQGNPYVSR